jgi:hypothetical protein
MADSNHAYGVLIGYNAGPGFDLATGLGSINASNFVNANVWASNTAPDFTVSSPNAIVTVTGGSSGTLSLGITSVNGFSGTFDLSAAVCSNMPAAATCSFSPPSITLTQANPSATVTVSIATTSRSTVILVTHL